MIGGFIDGRHFQFAEDHPSHDVFGHAAETADHFVAFVGRINARAV